MPAPTIQELEDALTDINDLESFINGSTPGDITTRLGTTYPNLLKVTQQVIAGDATGVGFDNNNSWLNSLNVQAAIDELSKGTAFYVNDYDDIRGIFNSSFDAADLVDGQPVIVTDEGIAGTFVLKNVVSHGLTDNGCTIIVINSDWYVERSNGGDKINALWFEGADIGAKINAATAAGYTTIYLPGGSYTQSTPLTQNQEVVIYSDYWDEFGTPPALITRDGDFSHIETTATFGSYGIEWACDVGVTGANDGLIMHGKFGFVGRVTSQTRDGFVISEASASHNLNNSIIAGAFSGNARANLVVDARTTSGSDNIDINTLLFKYCRCNSGRIGLHIKGGLWNEWQYVNTKGNTEIGTLIEADNVVSNNTFRLYNENTAGGAIDFYAVDGWTVYGGAPTQTSATTFTVTGDQTATFTAGKKIRFIDDGVTYWGTIDSSVFSSVTTVTVTVAGNVPLTSNLTEVSTDAAANYFRDNDFLHCRGLTKDDVYIENGNVFLAASSRQGIIANSEQPWVKAYLSSTASNVTGDGTVYNIPFDAVTKDTQGNYSSPTFTANLTGRYRLDGSVRLEGLAAGSHTRCRLQLITTGISYDLYDLNLDNFKSSTNTACLPWGVTVSMSSNDTATLRLTVSGGALDVDVSGAAHQTWIDAVFEG